MRMCVRSCSGRCGSVRRPNHSVSFRVNSDRFGVSSGRFVVRITLCNFWSVRVGSSPESRCVSLDHSGSVWCWFDSRRGSPGVRGPPSAPGRAWSGAPEVEPHAAQRVRHYWTISLLRSKIRFKKKETLN